MSDWPVAVSSTCVTQHSQEKKHLCSGGFRIRNPSKRPASNLRFRAATGMDMTLSFPGPQVVNLFFVYPIRSLLLSVHVHGLHVHMFRVKEIIHFGSVIRLSKFLT